MFSTRGSFFLLAAIAVFAPAQKYVEGMKRKETVVVFEGLSNCRKNQPNFFTVNYTMVQPNIYLINGSVEVNEQIGRPAKLVCNIYTCTENHEPKNCVFSQSLKVEGLCDKITMKNAVWSPFLDNSTIPRSCPIKKGTYNIYGSHFNLKTLTFIPNLYGKWKLQASIISKNTNALCMLGNFNIERV